ncbi:MAG: hypothetical protein SGPRY_002118 [Prymnesium sp.]
MGRVALVTGANKGVGYHIAQQLVTSGLFSHVILGCRDPVAGSKAALEIGAHFLQPIDISSTESASAFVASLQSTYGRLDVLVNNAAIAFKGSDPTPFEKQTAPTLDTNYRGTLDLVTRCLPLLRQGDDARIVNVASMAGRLSQLSPELQREFSSNSLTLEQLNSLVDLFQSDVARGTHKANGWSSSN